MNRRHQRGYSLLEITIGMAIFGMFLAVMFIITAEMRGWEKKLPVNFLKHPQMITLLARMRTDVNDAYGVKPYLDEYDGFKDGDKVLILQKLHESGTLEKVVWDMSEEGIVRRISYSGSDKTVWVARGLPPDFTNAEFDAVKTDSDRAWAVRLQAKDRKGNLAIDQIFQPRPYE